jgi:hypothetical protein
VVPTGVPVRRESAKAQRHVHDVAVLLEPDRLVVPDDLAAREAAVNEAIPRWRSGGTRRKIERPTISSAA